MKSETKLEATVFCLGYGKIRLGWNSEGVRNFFQNNFHHYMTKDPIFPVLSDRYPNHPYCGYSTSGGNALW